MLRGTLNAGGKVIRSTGRRWSGSQCLGGWSGPEGQVKYEQNPVAWAPEQHVGLLAECAAGGAGLGAEAVGGGPSG